MVHGFLYIYIDSQIQAFTAELTSKSSPVAVAAAASSTPSTGPQMESLEQMHDPAFQAGKLGFKIGAVVVKKRSRVLQHTAIWL